MLSLGERSFHVLCGSLFVGSLLLDTYARQWFGWWNPPRIGALSLVLGLVWVARYAAWRAELNDERARVEDDRLQRLERKIDALEDELTARRRSF